jgi:hypothetical protein
MKQPPSPPIARTSRKSCKGNRSAPGVTAVPSDAFQRDREEVFLDVQPLTNDDISNDISFSRFYPESPESAARPRG